ncbi:hypothetical protein KK137_09990 [Croceibacterium sp. LX-88]|uniref:YD repeat-containing protein n=1 Tax=Croceibacterium selenioxidans TaxID=2838833 RepID=A0ABS5W8E5_9SPHN|nr:hypothetical protein [Croceibacterium selenioxidans]MBT2134664.1 hypothetical protein [Croceibacterium selenioxidans]
MTVETTYDGLGRKTKELTRGSDLAAASLTQYSYDLAGHLTCTAVRMNPAIYGSLPASACTLGTEGSQGPDRITRNVYDAAGQLLQVREGVGTTIEAADVTYSYTPNGKQEYVIDANGNRAKLEYDGFGRQVKWIFPSPTKPTAFNPATQATALATAGAINAADYEQYGYDSNGNRTSLRKRDGSTLSYLFDALNRMTKKTVPERSGLAATNTRDVFYGYDLRSLPTYARFDSASGEGVSYSYDGFGNQLSETSTMGGTTRTVSAGFDAVGNVIGLTYPDGKYFEYNRYATGELSYVSYDGHYLFRQSLDNARRPKQIFRLDTTNTTWNFPTTFAYDAVSRLGSVAHDFAGISNDVTTSFTYNPASQIAAQTRDNDLYAWTGGANVNRDYAANGLNQYTTVWGWAYAYDANGNLTSDGNQTFAYDVENRLVSRSGGSTTATLIRPARAALRSHRQRDRNHEVPIRWQRPHRRVRR